MNKIRILIVEDESIVAFDLKSILQRLNYSVIRILKKGEDAIIKADSEKPDLILMDIMLAGHMTGIEAAQEIRKNNNIPIIYLTAYADPDTLSKAKFTEPAGYILKPFDEKVLLSTIEMALFKHQMDMRLKESEERYRHLVEQSPVAVGILSNRKVAYANPAAVKIFDAENSEQLINRPLLDFGPMGNKKWLKDIISKVFLQKANYHVNEERFLTLKGNTIYVDYTVIPILYNGKPSAQIVLRDITEERKRNIVQNATLRILQSANISDCEDELYSNLSKLINEIIPARNLYFVFYNKESNLLEFPYTTDELNTYSDRPFKNGFAEYVIKHKKSLLAFENNIKVLEKNLGIKYHGLPVKAWLGVPLQVHGKNGAIITLEYKDERVLTDHEKEILELLSFPLSRAIEKILAEEQMRKYALSLAQLNESKDKFFSIISHDLRSPFNSLYGYTEILKTEYALLSEKEKIEFIDALHSCARNLYSHINNIFEFSKFQTGHFDYNPCYISANEWIEKNISFLSGNFLRKELRVLKELQDNIKFYADEIMLDSVLQNVLSNAIKFSPRGSEIKICSSVLNNRVKFRIIDNGIGIPPHLMANLFNINKKVTVPGTDNEKGTGLGLILTKEFVEKNKGTIDVQSVQNKGTVISITLPVKNDIKETDHAKVSLAL